MFAFTVEAVTKSHNDLFSFFSHAKQVAHFCFLLWNLL